MNIVSRPRQRCRIRTKAFTGADDGYRRTSVAAGQQTAGRGAGGSVRREPHRHREKCCATTRRCATGHINAQTWCTHVTSPSVEESQAIFRTRALLEVANLPDVIARCQPPHLAALENIIQREQQAHEAHDGPAAIRHSADFHIQLQAISGNPVLTEMVTRLSQRSSLVIAAWGAPWRQGCRCDDHQQLVGLLRDKALQPLSEALMHHFDHIVASLCFERDGVSLPDFFRLFAGHKES